MCPNFAIYLQVKQVLESGKPHSNPKATKYWPLYRLLNYSELSGSSSVKQEEPPPERDSGVVERGGICKAPGTDVD